MIKEKLRQMYYHDGMSQIEIAEVFGVSQVSISKWMQKFGIETRTNSQSKLVCSAKPSEKFLKRMYYDSQMSVREIANKLKVSHVSVLRWIKSYGIELRILSDYVGENANNWQGGISFEPYCKKFNNEFKEAVRKRDDYTCQLCGYKQSPDGQKLDVHHIHYDKENCWPDVVALCRSCNVKVNANRSYWEEYFDLMLIEKGLFCWSIDVTA